MPFLHTTRHLHQWDGFATSWGNSGGRLRQPRRTNRSSDLSMRAQGRLQWRGWNRLKEDVEETKTKKAAVRLYITRAATEMCLPDCGRTLKIAQLELDGGGWWWCCRLMGSTAEGSLFAACRVVLTWQCGGEGVKRSLLQPVDVFSDYAFICIYYSGAVVVVSGDVTSVAVAELVCVCM